MKLKINKELKMNNPQIKISRISGNLSSSNEEKYHNVFLLKENIDEFLIDNKVFNFAESSVIFVNQQFNWQLNCKENQSIKGFILSISDSVFNLPGFKNLFISQINHFNTNEIPFITPSPGIAVRIDAILEMMDELIGSPLNNKEEGIYSLLNAFFIYCDGQCNIKSSLNSLNKNSKSSLVHKYKKLILEHLTEWHQTKEYAEKLNVTEKYLNECTKKVLNVSAKSLILEQLIMKSRRALKFSDNSVKEISYNLGFTSSDYFCAFFKTHTGETPTQCRNL